MIWNKTIIHVVCRGFSRGLGWFYERFAVVCGGLWCFAVIQRSRKRVPLLSFTPYSLLFTLRLFTYPYNLRFFFPERACFSIFNQVNISTALASSKEPLLRNPTKTATFNGHAKSSLVKNDTSWHDTDFCCMADVGVS